jgi:hypothetical protein
MIGRLSLVMVTAAALAACDGDVPGPGDSGGQPVVRLAGNLQADAPLAPAFDPSNWQGTCNFAGGLPAVVPDRPAALLFRRFDAGAWEWMAVDVAPGEDEVRLLARGELAFDDQGRLTAATRDPDDPGAPTYPFVLDFGSFYPQGSGTDGMTQLHLPSSTRKR